MVEVLPVVIGALGSIKKEFDWWLGKLGITDNVGVMEKTALLRIASMLRKALEMQRTYHSISIPHLL